MTLTTTLMLLRDGEQKTVMLGTLVFAPGPDASSSLVIKKDVAVAKSTPITIGSAITPNGNLSFAVFHDDIQHLLVTARWDSVAPYFGVRLPGLGFLHAYFKKTDEKQVT